MRGPGYKLTGDVRRTWRCSQCGRERKMMGDVTTLLCGCRDGAWMQIVVERTMIPRPIQRPSDVERRPIDFGIEPLPPAPAKPEATIIKSAVPVENEPNESVANPDDVGSDVPVKNETDDQLSSGGSDLIEDDWGEGIL